ncbi:MAG: hypothetical protein KF892_24025 [Rhizobacter sp.]|nr:hypothetical protein [Rhizobacter sp.]
MSPPQLIASIKVAFPVLPLPAMTLRQAQLADQSLAREISEEEWEAERSIDGATPWDEIEVSTLIECDAALSHLEDQSLCYYLPAYLCFCLDGAWPRNFKEEPVFWSTVFLLTSLSAYNVARLKHLTEVQVDLVCEFLEWVKDTDPIQRNAAEIALRSYWKTPDAKRRTFIQAL